MTIFDLVDSKPIAAYWNELESNRIPFLGEALFPAQKKVGLELKWIKGQNGLPVALNPSAFDTKPVIRGRIGVEKVETELPFFRESMRLGEKDRQQILQYMQNADSPYLRDVIGRIYADAANLVSGALVQPERMRMGLLVNGQIQIAAPTAKGGVTYNYDYDPTNAWRNANTATLTTTAKWDQPATANPVKDILDVKRHQRMNYGVEITRAIVTTKTWGHLLNNEAIKKDMNTLSGQNIILTDSMLQQYFLTKVGVTFVVYDKMYKDEAGQQQQFYPDDYVTFLPGYALGQTFFGTTPEEADLMGGQLADASVSVVNTGIAILTKKESLPVNIITSVSEIVLPSFERMDDIYTLKVA